MPKKRQSVQRLAAKNMARTTANRLISDTIGNGILGSVVKTLASKAISATDKVQYNKDFGMLHK